MNVAQLTLQRYWDSKLSRNNKNNPFPLAPKDLVRMGLVTSENYQRENKKFSAFTNRIMKRELDVLEQMFKLGYLICPDIKVFGVGLARGLGWIKKGLAMGIYVKTYDASTVACANVSFLTRNYPNLNLLDVTQGEIEVEWTGVDNGCMYFLSQFVQVLKKTKMRRVMRKLGSILKTNPLSIKRSLYIVHPLPTDNDRRCEWGGIGFPWGVEWGDTTPYSLDELLDAIGGKKATRRLNVEVLGTHTYFHQKYSFLKIQHKG